MPRLERQAANVCILYVEYLKILICVSDLPPVGQMKRRLVSRRVASALAVQAALVLSA